MDFCGGQKCSISISSGNYFQIGISYLQSNHSVSVGNSHVWEKGVIDVISLRYTPDSKVHEAIMGPIWGRQDPGGPHVGPMKFAI